MAGRSDRLVDAMLTDLTGFAIDLADTGVPELVEVSTRVREQAGRVQGSATDRRAALGSLLCQLVVAARRAGVPVPRKVFTTSVRHLAEELGRRHPGQTIEVRVPPLTAVQICSLASGPTHTRGTPPNVVETDGETWFDLATGAISFEDARAAHRVRSSGAHAAELSAFLPVPLD